VIFAHSAPSTFALYLTGRRRWVGICHEETDLCQSCLRAIAAFLAEEMGWRYSTALERPAASYAAELNLSIDEALELRRLTILACFSRRPDFNGFTRTATTEDLIVVDELVLIGASA
jgi:hypothetical protein